MEYGLDNHLRIIPGCVIRSAQASAGIPTTPLVCLHHVVTYVTGRLERYWFPAVIIGYLNFALKTSIQKQLWRHVRLMWLLAGRAIMQNLILGAYARQTILKKRKKTFSGIRQCDI